MLKKNEKITIPFSQDEVEELMDGQEFHWTFKTNKGRAIDVHIKQEEEDDIEDFSN